MISERSVVKIIGQQFFFFEHQTHSESHKYPQLPRNCIYSISDVMTVEMNWPKLSGGACSEAEGACQHGAEQGSFSGSQSPQSVGSGAMDSGTEYLSDSTCYNMDISMSLCGQEGDTSQITKGRRGRQSTGVSGSQIWSHNSLKVDLNQFVFLWFSSRKVHETSHHIPGFCQQSRNHWGPKSCHLHKC